MEKQRTPAFGKIEAIFHNSVTAWIVLSVSLVLTAAAWFVANNFVNERAHDRFIFQVDDLESAIKQRMIAYESLLRGGIGLFHSSNHVDRTEWAAYVENLDIEEYFPGIGGFGFSRWIQPADKAAFEESIRQEGFTDFKIKPDGARDAYSSIQFLEPFDWRNQRAFGYDMYSNAVRREAMEKARDTGQAVISGKVTLVQETNEDVQAGFLMYLPLYEKDTPLTSTAERRDKLLGWVYSPFRMKDLMQGILGAGESRLSFEIFDGEKIHADALLYDSEPHVHNDGNIITAETKVGADDAFSEHRAINLSGRTWSVFVYTLPDYLSTSEDIQPTFVAIGGIIINILLFIVILSISKQKSWAEARAAKMTAELREQLHKTQDAQHRIEEQAAKLADLAKTESGLRIKAESAEKAKSDFLASMSHEIRTPMTGVLGFADMLLEDGLQPESADKVQKIKAVSQSLLTIINDILDISKLDAGKMKLESIDVAPMKIVEEIIGMFRQTLSQDKRDRITVSFNTDDGFPDVVRTDPTRLRQVLINLIGNAIKFTDDGSIRVHAAHDKLGKTLTFQITDTGIGIDQNSLGGLFADFTQADSSISRKYQGSGLGLSICKRLVELMGGEIGIESAPSQGSTFWFRIPYQDAIGFAVHEQRFDGQTAHYGSSRALSVLVAEDNEINQTIIKSIVSGMGHNVTFANNGQEAVDCVMATDFDLILMDVRMPILSGPEATIEIRKLPGSKGTIPIIALTADVMADNRQSYFDAGMNDCVGKPIDRVELATAINKAIGETVNMRDDRDITSKAPPSTAAYDLNAITKRLMLPKDVLSSLLLKFCTDYADAGTRLHALSEGDDPEAAADLAHDIKGVSATLGATDVSELAATIEKAFRNRETANVDTMLDMFSSALAETIKSIRRQV
tara:strand:+ start:167601 stop:170330 length:2730 start_codon:yes stop_codon:yes gene_type:complete